jgi:SAM-dependent methyltransferase
MFHYEELLGSLRAAYDRGAEYRENLVRQPWKLAERSAFLSLLQSEGARRLLEVGAGTGQDSSFFASQGLSVVATDLSPAMVSYCRAKGLDARVVDVLALDFPPASFDAVYSVNCLLHVPNVDLPRALSTIASVLRPGGLFYLGLWGGESSEGILERDQHVPKRFFSFRTDAEIQSYVTEFFSIVDFHRVTTGDVEPYQSLTLRRPGLT